MAHPITNTHRIAKNALMLYIRMLVMMFIGLYTSRIIINALGIQDYGLFNVIGGFIAFLGFINSSLSSATSRFLTFELGRSSNSIYRLKKIFSNCLTLHALLAIIIFVIGEILGFFVINYYLNIPNDRLSTCNLVFHVLLVSSVFTFLIVPFNADIIAHEEMDAFAYFTIIDSVLNLGSAFWIMYLSSDRLLFYSVLLFLIQVLDFLMYFVYCKYHFKESSFRFGRNKKLLKELYKFSGWNILQDFATICCNQGLNLLLNMFFLPVVNAARGIMIQVQQAVAKMSINFQISVNPQITKSYATKDYNSMQRLVFISSRFSFFLLLIPSIPIFYFTNDIFVWWLKIVPTHTVNFVHIILFEAFCSILSNPLSVSVKATGNISTYQSVNSLLMLTVLPISYIALKYKCSPEIVFIIFVFVSFISYLYKVHYVRRYLNFDIKFYFKEVLSKVFFVTILTILAQYLYKSFINWGSIFFQIVISVVIPIFIVAAFGFSRHERRRIYQYIQNRRKGSL